MIFLAKVPQNLILHKKQRKINQNPNLEDSSVFDRFPLCKDGVL